MDYPVTRGVQQLPTSQVRLSVLDRVACGLYIKRGYPLHILEIGSLYGDSAKILARYGEVLCVDLWDFPLGLETFAGNVGGMKVKALMGKSQDILPEIDSRSFDLIYIDGCHTYPTVDYDIGEAKRLIKPSGVICGDDLEKEIRNVSDYMHADAHKTTDYIDGYHPGITLAIYKAFKPDVVKNESGFWWVNT